MKQLLALLLICALLLAMCACSAKKPAVDPMPEPGESEAAPENPSDSEEGSLNAPFAPPDELRPTDQPTENETTESPAESADPNEIPAEPEQADPNEIPTAPVEPAEEPAEQPAPVVPTEPSAPVLEPEPPVEAPSESPDGTIPADENDTQVDSDPQKPLQPEVLIAPNTADSSMVKALWDAFVGALNENPAISMEELANQLLSDPVIEFMPMAMPIEVGAEYFPGFDQYIIADYDAAATFGPMIGSIPFVGYVFDLTDGTDAQGFCDALTANCNPRWNICVSADVTAVGAFGDKVFFLMCPGEKEPAEDAPESFDPAE